MAAAAISLGTAMVLARAASTSMPERTAPRKARKATESSSISSSARSRNASARECAAPEPGQRWERMATFWRSAAAVATTAAAADPLAGAGAPDAILLRR